VVTTENVLEKLYGIGFDSLAIERYISLRKWDTLRFMGFDP